MVWKLSQRSKDNLKNVHPDLIRVIKTALSLSPVDFTVIEGRRTVERQKQLVASGASKTMNSRHLHGFAVDLLPIDPATGKGAFDWPLYHKLAPAVKQAAALEGVSITWGGDWTTFRDGPHFELPHALYKDGMQFAAIPPDSVASSRVPDAPEPPAAQLPAEPAAGPKDEGILFKWGTYKLEILDNGDLIVIKKEN